jgi:hypothetical protein
VDTRLWGPAEMSIDYSNFSPSSDDQIIETIGPEARSR